MADSSNTRLDAKSEAAAKALFEWDGPHPAWERAAPTESRDYRAFASIALAAADSVEREHMPDIPRLATEADQVMAGTLSTIWPMCHRHPEDALHLAVFVNDLERPAVERLHQALSDLMGAIEAGLRFADGECGPGSAFGNALVALAEFGQQPTGEQDGST